VGSSKVMKTDVRVIAATNVNLQHAVAAGRFREDLYYRLSTVPITIPSLRERGEDIYLLFRKFSTDFAEKNRIAPIKLSDEARHLVVKYNWPGNVRQLKNVAEQVSILALEREVSAQQLIDIVPDIANNKLPALMNNNAFDGSGTGFTEREILYKLIFDVKKDLNDLKQFVFDIAKGVPAQHTFETGDLPNAVPSYTPATGNQAIVLGSGAEHRPVILQDKQDFRSHETIEENLSLLDKERELIIKALKKHRNKRRDAAEDLGISERTLYRKIKEYNLDE